MGAGVKLCLYQPDGHCRRPGASTSSEHPKRPQTQPRDSLKLGVEGPVTSGSAGESCGGSGVSGDLTSSRCFTWSSVLLLGGPISFKRKEKRGRVSGRAGSEPWGQQAVPGSSGHLLPGCLQRGQEAGPAWSGACSPWPASSCSPAWHLPRRGGVRGAGLGDPGGPGSPLPPATLTPAPMGATDWQAASSAVPPAAGSGRSWSAC